MHEVNFHYAYTLGNYIEENNSTVKTELVLEKCLTSFLNSIQYCINKFPDSNHTIGFFYKSYYQQSLLDKVKLITSKYTSTKLNIEFNDVFKQGENGNLLLDQQSFHWLQSKGQQFVFNVQDNFLFNERCILEMYNISNQIKFATGFDLIVSPFNYFSLWLAAYGDPQTQQTVNCGDLSWVNYYDLSSTFMTTHKQFSDNWNTFFKYFNSTDEERLEHFNSLNTMLRKNNNYGFIPLKSLSFFITPEIFNSDNIEFKMLWDSIDGSL